MYLRITAFLLFLSLYNAEEVKRDEGVLVLTNDNFDSIVKSHEHVLVEFYAPWCGHCKALAPEYAKAAQELAAEKSEIQLAKVDATEETELAEKFEIRGYPTLKFYRNGNPTDYSGGRTSKEILQWLKKKTGPPAKELTKGQDLEDLKKDQKVVVVGYFTSRDEDQAKVYLDVAADIDDYPLGISTDEALLKEANVEPNTVVIYKDFDDKESKYTGPYSKEELTTFISTHSMPLVVDFNHESAQKIFGGTIKTHNLLFLSKNSPEYKDLLETFTDVAKEFRGKVLFVTIDIDQEEHERIVEFFGLKTEDIPSLRLIRLQDDMTKYKPPTASKEGGLEKGAIKDFVQGVLDGKVKPHMLSQDLPEDWDKNPVKILVSSNFDSVALDKSKDVLVEFYAPWCGHCKQLAPVYEELGKKFKDHPTLVIAKMDATLNELEHTKINSFPTLKLYKKDTNEVVDYNGERTLDGISTFLETGGEYGKAPPEEEEEDEAEEDDDDSEPKKDEL